MDEKNALEEIAFIKKVMSDSRKTVLMHGRDFIAWGIITTIGFLSSYIMFEWKIKINVLLLWSIIIGLGYAINIFFMFKYKRNRTEKYFATKILNMIWMACGITMCINGFISVYSGAIKGMFVSPVLCSIMGIAHFLTGIILDQKYIKYSSIAWWSSSIIMFFYPGTYTMLLMASLMILFQIIPGFIIYRKFLKSNTLI